MSKQNSELELSLTKGLLDQGLKVTFSKHSDLVHAEIYEYKTTGYGPDVLSALVQACEKILARPPSEERKRKESL